jgi:hypothetical protein
MYVERSGSDQARTQRFWQRRVDPAASLLREECLEPEEKSCGNMLRAPDNRARIGSKSRRKPPGLGDLGL